MNGDAPIPSRENSGTLFPLVLALFAAGLVHALLPVGAFGSYDVVTRAAITAATAAGTALFLNWLNKRRAGNSG